MRTKHRFYQTMVAGLAGLIWAGACLANTATGVGHLTVPPGYQIDVLVNGVTNARQMAMGSETLFVGSHSEGVVYAVRDPFGEPQVQVILKDLTMPSGIAWRDGDLYVAAVDKLYRLSNIEHYLQSGQPIPAPELIYDQLPKDTHHGWKNIAFGPDGLLYIPIGAPCNICEPGSPYASIRALNITTGELKLVAEGVRNSVGFDWHPATGQLWFSDNGRDWLGDELPPEEINVVSKAGQHFGYPYVHGSNIEDPEFFSRKPKGLEITPPRLAMTAHSAPLGLLFYTGQQFPQENGQQMLFLAQHGSWNRSDKVGYRVMEILLGQAGQVIDFRPFIDGWLAESGDVTGRPVAFLQLADGSMLVSDDMAGVIYRVTYSASN